MSFGQELKDFVGGFEKGWKLATPTRGDVEARAYKDMKRERDEVAAAQERERGDAAVRKALPVPRQYRSGTGTPGSNSDSDVNYGDVAQRLGGDRGDDDVLVNRVLAAEAGSEGDEGLAAAAHVIRNRADLGGKSYADVVRAPGQFEAYGNRSYARSDYTPGSQAYERAARVMAGVRAGTIADPTGISPTHYYNPRLNKELAQRDGRRATPPWDDGSGTRLGRHVFFSRPGDFGGARRRVADASAAAGVPRTSYASAPGDEGDEEEGYGYAQGGYVEGYLPESDWRRYNAGDYVSADLATDNVAASDEREALRPVPPEDALRPVERPELMRLGRRDTPVMRQPLPPPQVLTPGLDMAEPVGEREELSGSRPEITRFGRPMPRQDLSAVAPGEPLEGTEVHDPRHTPLEEPRPGEPQLQPLEPRDIPNSPLEEPRAGKRRPLPRQTVQREASKQKATTAPPPGPAPRPKAIATTPEPAAQEPVTQAIPTRDIFNSDKAGTGSEYDPRMFANPQGAAQALDAGMRRIAEVFGPAGAIGAADPKGPDKAAAFARNVGAPSIQEVRAVQQVVDPRGVLTDSERTMASLYAGYDYYLKRGEPQKAANYAMSMMLHAKRAIQLSGSLATAALERGDAVGAAKAIAGGYTQVPDGREVKVLAGGPQGVEFGVYDRDGKLTDKGRASLNDLMRVATGMRDGTEWFRSMGMAIDNAAGDPTKERQLRIRERALDQKQRDQELREQSQDLRKRGQDAKEAGKGGAQGGTQGGGVTPGVRGTRSGAGSTGGTRAGTSKEERQAAADAQELADARLRDQGAQLDEPQSFRENRVGNREQAAGALADVRYKQATGGKPIESDREVDSDVNQVLNLKEGEKLDPRLQFAWRTAVSQLAGANAIDYDQAAYLAGQAVGGDNVQLQEGRLVVPGFPKPLVVGRDTLAQLGLIRGELRARTARKAPAQAVPAQTVPAQTAQTVSTGPQKPTTDADLAAAQRVKDRNRRQAIPTYVPHLGD